MLAVLPWLPPADSSPTLPQLPRRLDRNEVRQVQCRLARGRQLQVVAPCGPGGASATLLEGELHAAVRGWEDGSVWAVATEGEHQVREQLGGSAGGPAGGQAGRALAFALWALGSTAAPASP